MRWFERSHPPPFSHPSPSFLKILRTEGDAPPTLEAAFDNLCRLLVAKVFYCDTVASTTPLGSQRVVVVSRVPLPPPMRDTAALGGLLAAVLVRNDSASVDVPGALAGGSLGVFLWTATGLNRAFVMPALKRVHPFLSRFFFFFFLTHSMVPFGVFAIQTTRWLTCTLRRFRLARRGG